MLSLLRKVRKTLISQNKVTHYLAYAIGEIILVVIGILIALQVNSSYQVAKTKQLEVKYLKEMRNNLIFDLNDIDFNIRFNESRYASNEIVLQHLRRRLPYHDSLDFHLSNLLLTTRSISNTSAYEGLKSRGLEIISNDSLRAEITKMYTFSFPNAIDFEHVDDHPHQYNIVWPAVTKAIELDSLGRSAKPINYDAMLNDIQFKNALATNLTLRNYMLDTYKGLRANVTHLISQIESELVELEGKE
jgi:hypothetical protein